MKMPITQKLSEQDLDLLVQLIRVYEDVFEMQDFVMPDSGYLRSLLVKDQTFFYVALENEQVIGGLTAHVLPSTYYPSGEVYIYDLAVKREFQRKGIGRELLNALSKYSSELGMKEIFVQADLEDEHALDFYQSTGGIPERVVHFSYALSKG